MAMLAFMNANQGAFLVILTAAYVTITAILIHLNIKAVNEMQKTREQQVNPNVAAAFHSLRGGLLCLVFKNYGASSAYNLSIDVSQNLMDILDKKYAATFEHLRRAALVLAPLQEAIYTLGGLDIFPTLPRTTIELRYQNDIGKEFQNRIILDFPSFDKSLLYGPPFDEMTTVLARSLCEIKKELDAIRRDVIERLGR